LLLKFKLKCENCKVLLNKDHAMCGKERFIGSDRRAITLFGFRVRWPGWKWVVGFIGGVKPRGRERVSGFWLSVITRWKRSTCLASWVTESSWVVLQAEKQSGREKQVVINQGVWFSVLALGHSAHPKNARDLTRIKQTYKILLKGKKSWVCTIWFIMILSGFTNRVFLVLFK
jgi:hypothetical protein